MHQDSPIPMSADKASMTQTIIDSMIADSMIADSMIADSMITNSMITNSMITDNQISEHASISTSNCVMTPDVLDHTFVKSVKGQCHIWTVSPTEGVKIGISNSYLQITIKYFSSWLHKISWLYWH